MANQFTSGGGSKGPKKHHDEATKDKIRAELVAQRLHKFAMAKGQKAAKLAMSGPQVAAAKVIVDKGKPSLQAIEQTEVNPTDRMSEDELRGMVRALITSNPWLLNEFQPGVRAAETTGSDANSVVDPQQTQRSNGNTA